MVFQLPGSFQSGSGGIPDFRTSSSSSLSEPLVEESIRFRGAAGFFGLEGLLRADKVGLGGLASAEEFSFSLPESARPELA